MKRYYYDDALQAAWMAREFGVKYARGDQCVIGWEDMRSCAPEAMDAPFYVHPDSLHLLEPQHNDLFQPDVDLKIIQRNGKAFMWPKEENNI